MHCPSPSLLKSWLLLCYLVHKRYLIFLSSKGDVLKGMLTLSSFGIAASLSRHISPYRSCVSLSDISPSLCSSRWKKNSLVLSWQLIWCTAVCSPEQSVVIREYVLQEHMLLRKARQVFWKRPCWFPPALTFPTIYCLVSLCCLRKRTPDFTCLQKPLCCSSLSLHV